MTNYNERLDEILDDYADEHRNHAYDFDNKEISQTEYFKSMRNDKQTAKQAITSLTKELVADAKPMVASKEVIETYLQNGMTQKAAEYHGRNHAIEQFEQNLLKALEEV